MKKLLKIIGIILLVWLFLLLIGFFKKPVKPNVIGGYGSHNPPEWVTEQKTWEDEIYDITGEVREGMQTLGDMLHSSGSISNWSESKKIKAKVEADKISSGYQKGKLLDGEGYRFEQWLKAMEEYDNAMFYFKIAIDTENVEAFHLCIDYLEKGSLILDMLNEEMI